MPVLNRLEEIARTLLASTVPELQGYSGIVRHATLADEVAQVTRRVKLGELDAEQVRLDRLS